MRSCVAVVVACLLAGRALPGFPESIPGDPGPRQAVRTRYTLRLEELQRLRHRLLIDTPGLRLLVIGELDGSQPAAIRVGAALPFGVAGPLAPTGLWRKIVNPLAHGLGSTAHEERTGLRLDASLDGSSRSGVTLQVGRETAAGRAPAPTDVPRVDSSGRQASELAGGLALLGLPGAGFQAGGWLELERSGAFLTALASCSGPPEEHPGDSWLLGETPYPGGGLLHLAGGFRGCSDRASLFWAGALSGGPLTGAGVFSDLVVRVCGPAGQAELLGGVCSRGYRRPDGSTADRSLHASAALELESPALPGAGGRAAGAALGVLACRLRMEAGTAAGLGTAGPIGARPDGAGGVPGEGEWWLSSECRWVRRAAAGRTLRLVVRGAREVRWSAGSVGGDAAGEEPPGREDGLSEAVGIELTGESPRGSLEAELSVRSRDGEGRFVLELRGRRVGERQVAMRQVAEKRAVGRRTGWLLLRVQLRRPHGPQCPPTPGFLTVTGRGELAWEGNSLFLQVTRREEVPLAPGAGGEGPALAAGGLPAVTLGWEVRVPAGGRR